MGGWNRLFVGVSLLLCVPSAIYAIAVRPNASDSFYTFGCDGYPQYLTQQSASESLALEQFTQSPYSSSSCKESLNEIATGQRLDQAIEGWGEDVGVGAIAISILLGSLYIIGWGIGWIWRGFSPKP